MVFNGKNGFTIIESLFAMVLLLITLTGGMAYFYNAHALNIRSVHLSQATLLAGSRMEDIRKAGYDAITNAPQNYRETDTPVAIGQMVGGKRTTAITVHGGPANTHYAAVTVAWPEPGEAQDKAVKLETYIGSR